MYCATFYWEALITFHPAFVRSSEYLKLSLWCSPVQPLTVWPQPEYLYEWVKQVRFLACIRLYRCWLSVFALSDSAPMTSVSCWWVFCQAWFWTVLPRIAAIRAPWHTGISLVANDATIATTDNVFLLVAGCRCTKCLCPQNQHKSLTCFLAAKWALHAVTPATSGKGSVTLAFVTSKLQKPKWINFNETLSCRCTQLWHQFILFIHQI